MTDAAYPDFFSLVTKEFDATNKIFRELISQL